MEIDKLAAAAERFFLDIMGSVIPGALVLVGLYATTGPIQLGDLAIQLPTTSAGWTFFGALAYVTGHALTSIGEVSVAPLTARVVTRFARKGYDGPVMRENRLYDSIRTGMALTEFVRLYHDKKGRSGTADELNKNKIQAYRAIAMTISKPEDRATAIRFMFLSLLNLGTATTVWIVGLAFGVRFIADDSGAVAFCTPEVRLDCVEFISRLGLAALSILIAAAVLSAPFLQRRFYFHRMSLELPFSTAAGVLKEEARETTQLPSPSASPAGGKTVVYLAGGLHTGWQNDVIAQAHEFTFLNPREHHLADPAAYTAWDLEAVRTCDVVFACLEGSNPGGYSLALEVGHAAALKKPIILVDTKSALDERTASYLAMVREVATYATESLTDGIRYLKAHGRIHSQST